MLARLGGISGKNGHVRAAENVICYPCQAREIKGIEIQEEARP